MECLVNFFSAYYNDDNEVVDDHKVCLFFESHNYLDNSVFLYQVMVLDRFHVEHTHRLDCGHRQYEQGRKVLKSRSCLQSD